VVIGEEVINFIDNKINVPENTNIINIKCLANFINCDNMFENITNIIEVNLLNFDISQVTSMRKMFNNCANLIKIITPKDFKAFSLTTIHHMFCNCTSKQF